MKNTSAPISSPRSGATGARSASSRSRLRRGLLGLLGLLGLVALAGTPAHPAAADEQDVGGFRPYQEAFAEVLDELGTSGAPAGPVWLEPQGFARKEGCTSCHLGIGDNRFLYARQPYRRHTGHHLEDHSAERFGCTVCHGGVADALDFASAGHAARSDARRRESWERQLSWRPPGEDGMVPLAAITGRCTLCHPANDLPAGGEPYGVSRSLVAQKRCAACHRFRDEPVTAVRRAETLDDIGSKVGAGWLTAFLEDPHAVRPGTAMPAYRYSAEEVSVLAEHLLSLGVGEATGAGQDPAVDAGAVERGRAAIVERKCRTCHDLPGIEDEGFVRQRKIGPSLARVGEKLRPAWIRAWLADPHAVRPGNGMPRFRLTAPEIADLTAYLSSLRQPGAAPPAVAAAATTAGGNPAAAAAKYRCTACHAIRGLDSAPPARIDSRTVGPAIFARLAQRDLEGGNLEGPGRLFHQDAAAPRLFADGEDATPLLTFLAGQADVPIPDALRRPQSAKSQGFDGSVAAGGLVQELRCLSCHTIRGSGGDTGPDLTFAGSRLQRDWLVGFLQRPDAIRPMNRARMPNLGLTEREAETLADWIVSDLRSPDVEAGEPDLESAFAFVGAAKVKTPYGCITCHTIGDHGGRVGPELTHVGSRLTTKWIFHWIKDPKRWIHDVRMPNFEMDEEDLAAITKYLSEQR